MALSPGTSFGAHKIIGRLGAGGMGEVYRARDTTLEREVAIKVLPESFANDAGRSARFEQEAKTLAALNHPNIAQIYGLERSSGTTALVMELVEGPTLADRIAQGPIPADEALNIAMQIATALEAAHERSIVHRDLKPANIKLKPDGTVKVLDFGIAKAFELRPLISGPPSPVMTTPVTQAGVILGTAAYMSPEQARGKGIDQRADIWAFGCVLYEMLTGQPVFAGEDVTVTLARVLERDTDTGSLRMVAPAVRHTIKLCLEKDVRKRIADIRDVKLALDGRFDPGPGDRPEGAAIAAARPAWRRLLPVAAAVLAGALIAGFAAWFLARPEPPRLVRLTMAHPGGEPIGLNYLDANVAISRDGRFVAYTGGGTQSDFTTIYVRALDSLSAMRISSFGRTPFFSPNDEWIGFVSDNATLQRTATAGGPALPIGGAVTGARGASWGSDDTIVFATIDPASGLLRIAAAGGEMEILTTPDGAGGESDHLFPRFLPDARHVLFTIANPQGVTNFQVAVLDLMTRDYRVLIQGGSDAHYVPSGHLVYGSAGNLLAVPFDLRGLEVRGSPVPVVEGVATKATGATSFAVADNGTLVYISGGAVQSIVRSVVWVSRDGAEEPIALPPRNYHYVQLSPDGQRLALDVRDQENDIWVWDLARASLQRLTFDPGFNRSPVWSPDGARIAFSRGIEGHEEVYWQAWDGAGVPEPLTQGSEGLVFPTDISADGQNLFFSEVNRPRDAFRVSIGGQADAGTAILNGPASEEGATLSPDGRWLAYQSDESGRSEIYVRPFPDVEEGRWQISTSGGTRPRWSRSGEELFYYYGDENMNGLMVVDVDEQSSFRASAPRRLIQGAYDAPNTGRQVYDVSLDGQRFLMIKRAETAVDAPEPQIIVVQNWLEELKRLVPTE